MKNVSIIGSTGSIGRQALDVAACNTDKINIVALAAGSNIELLLEQIHKFKPRLVSVASRTNAEKLKQLLGDNKVPEIMYGTEGLIAVAAYSDADIVLTAVTGTVGLLPTLKAIEAGKDIALANKETLVAAGRLVMEKAAAKGVNLYPVDSEHSAIWQCLNSEPRRSVSKLILTASGGPFRNFPREKMPFITPEMALKHPNWEMGHKITIDSATLMNKGLEVIEAKWLFGVRFEEVQVVVHAQSIIHSMVEFVDGSVIAHLGIPDMRIPIQYALSYPHRWPNHLPRLDLLSVQQLTFEPPDLDRFPCLKLAYQAGSTGGTMPAVLNAANEVAVTRFLKGEIGFMDIPATVHNVMEKHRVISNPELDDILAADRWAREEAGR
ncbi:1-deoxy-D-xylulose-5-phosphate reductoisomerase [Desulfohalotomaculum tongense]|uniref:1-deoxy-D-xylulose-5-phosphate reductoisomerase n=1 Tax=Desulforadius tongensis TaxID=1216062 RepID=UPI00195A0644|nr:1-deoxy-D-xylulose-5-phosphate reductoisomerase [Desulforadius tongensis]